MEIFVVLVLIGALVRNFDDGVDDLGAMGPYREFQVVRHKICISFRVEGSGARGVMLILRLIANHGLVHERKPHLVYNQTG
jgi:hypothetical protein